MVALKNVLSRLSAVCSQAYILCFPWVPASCSFQMSLLTFTIPVYPSWPCSLLRIFIWDTSGSFSSLGAFMRMCMCSALPLSVHTLLRRCLQKILVAGGFFRDWFCLFVLLGFAAFFFIPFF